MKICYINPTNALRRPIAELSKQLAAQGHQVTVMYPSSKACPVKNWVPNAALESGTIKLRKIPSYYLESLRYSFPNLRLLWKNTKEIFRENDRVHIWEYYYPISVLPLLYALTSKKRRRKLILTSDGFVGYSYTPKDPWWLVPAFRMYTQSFARFLFKIPPKMTTYGRALLPAAKKAGVPLGKLQILSTGIHLDRFKGVSKKELAALRKEFSLQKGKDEQVILFVGMLTERKGVKTVVKVGADLLRSGKKVKVLIVGDAHGENVYEKYVAPEFKDKIIFTGGRKDIPALMKVSDVLLLPSEGEGLPGVVMEAMCSELACVATDEGCTRDLLLDNEAGVLVPLGSSPAVYRRAVEKVLDNPKKYGRRGKELIKHFSWDVMLKRYKKLYGL